MLLTIAIAASVAFVSSEWVEISQQHYRKPVHLSQSYPSITDDQRESFHEDSTTLLPNHPERGPFAANYHKDSTDSFNYGMEATQKNRHGGQEKIDSNVSIMEQSANPHRNRGPDDIHRDTIFDLKPSPDQHPIRDLTNDRTLSQVTNKDQASATIERVPNMGNVFRVNLYNTPVKSPSLKNDVTKINNLERDRVNFAPTNNDSGDELVVKSDIFTNDPETVGIADITKQVLDRDRIITLKNSTIINSKIKTIQNSYDQREINAFVKIKKADLNDTSYNDISRIETKVPNTQTKLTDIFLKERKGDQINTIPNFVTVSDQSEHATTAQGEKEGNTPVEKSITTPPNIQTEPENVAKSPHNDNKANSNEVKINAMQNVMKFMTMVTETISKNAKRGVGGKVKYLNELKDNLLGSIKARIDATWPDDDSVHRRSRSTARGHVEFPSSESSLMTISFLTFAVFLIKLVLQVIQTYKNKSMMVAPLVVATAGRAIRKLRQYT